jgi:hypothetical protein
MSALEGFRSFNRFELKYLLDVGRIPALAADLANHLRPDQHGDAGQYALTSLYYDSPDLVCYWAKIDGLKTRRKVRIRRYETGRPLTPSDPVFVEIKQRVNRVTQKRRIGLPYAEAVALCGGGAPEAGEGNSRAAVAHEVADLVERFSLRPTAVTSYLRTAWVGGDYDPGVRVTFDRDLRYRLGNLDLAEQVAGSHLLPPHLVVVEVKVNDRVPAWLTRLASRHDLTLVRLSKYCAAIDAGGHRFAASGGRSTLNVIDLGKEAPVRG